MERIIDQLGYGGFMLVDKKMPPFKNLTLEIRPGILLPIEYLAGILFPITHDRNNWRTNRRGKWLVLLLDDSKI